MRLTGKIVTWKGDKGYGFVKPDSESKNIFMHINEFNWKPRVGEEITFVMGKDKRGRTCGKEAMQKGQEVGANKSNMPVFLGGLVAVVVIVAAVIYFIN